MRASGYQPDLRRPRWAGGECCSLRFKERDMLGWAITFFVIAIIAALLGFGGMAAGAASIAQILFVIFLILFLISLVWHLVSGRRPPPVV
jgi:uncharacterized membrane protein YtjA (UPF0391 family)